MQMVLLTDVVRLLCALNKRLSERCSSVHSAAQNTACPVVIALTCHSVIFRRTLHIGISAPAVNLLLRELLRRRSSQLLALLDRRAPGPCWRIMSTSRCQRLLAVTGRI